MKRLKRLKILLPLMIVICMMFAGADTASADTRNFLSDSDTVKVVSIDEQYEIIDGVYEATITLENTLTGNKSIKTHVLLVKPYAKASFKPVIPGYYSKISGGTAEDRKAMEWGNSDFHEAGVTQMVNEYKSAGDAKPVLAAFNGSFSNGLGAPESKVIIDGREIYHTTHADQFIFGHKSKSGVMNIVQSGQGQDSAFDEAITGNFFFVRNGVVCNYLEADANNDGQYDHRQRHGVGIRTNGDVLVVTTEGGILVQQFAELLDASGCYNAINLDGGGSINFQTDRGDGESLKLRTPTAKSMGYASDSYGDREVPDAFMLVADDNTVANNVGDVSGHKIATDKTEYKQGEKIYVTASSEEEGAWVGLFHADQEDVSKNYLAWYYVYGTNDLAGTWCWDQGATNDFFAEASSKGPTSSAALSPGKYKVCVVDSKGAAQATSEFTIVEDPDAPKYDYSIKTDKDVYEVGEPIMTTMTAPASDGLAWVGITEHGHVAAGDNATYYWYYNSSTNAGITHSNGVTYNLLEQEQIGDEDIKDANVNPNLIDREKKQLLPGKYDIIVYPANDYSPAVVNGVTVKKTITIVDTKAVYDITYKDGEKNLTGLTPATYTYLASQDSDIQLPATASKEGHEFAGWYDNAELNGNPVTKIPQGSNGNKTFYAKFNKLNYEVTFDTDGGTAIESQTVAYGDKVSKPADPEKTDYQFLGWVTEKNGTVTFDFESGITGPTTVYAKWGYQGDYIVAFDTDGGSAVTSQSVKAGLKAEKPETDPTKPGYTFDKWVTSKNGDTAYDFDAEVTDNLTIYAKWNLKEHKVSFDVEGIDDITYTIESETFTLPEVSKEGYTFKGWAKEDGTPLDKIEKGTYGDISLKAQWKKNDFVSTDRDEYYLGQKINVTAYSEMNNAWVGLYKSDVTPGSGVDSYYWTYIADMNGEEFNILKYNKQGDLETGKYKVVLLYEDANSFYNVIQSKEITIVENTNPVKGTLTMSGASRTDKIYSGGADYDGVNWMEYYYGDAIYAEVSLEGNGQEGAWVGIVSEDSYVAGRYTELAGDNWYYVEDFEGQKVNLNYISNSELKENANFAKRGMRWAVLVSGSGELLDSVPLHIRTYNVDWYEDEKGTVWGNSVRDRIEVTAEWTNKVVNGEDQRPEVTIKQINGHFGYTRNADGDLVEITEYTLEEGKDYTLKYPSESKAVGAYNIEIKFPKSDSTDTFNYLSAKPQYYGLEEGVSYYITESENDRIIQYNGLNGASNDGNPEIYQTGTELKLIAPSRTGFIFDGWYTTADFKSGTMIESIEADEDSNLKLYAKWTKETDAPYEIKYVLDGGDNNIKNPSRYTGEADLALYPAEKRGYTFDGWFFDKNFKYSADVIKKGNDENLTVYAKFTKIAPDTFDITTEVTGGTISDNATVEKGDSFTVEYEGNSGYILKAVTVDGQAVDISEFASSYTFSNVTADHKISVEFGKPDLAAPAKATLVLRTITGGYNDVKFSWSEVDGADGYVVYYKKATAANYTKMTTTTALSVVKNNLTAGARYYFKVVPYVKSGDEIFEASAFKTANLYTLKRVSTPKVKRSGSKVRVSWTNINGETGYQISRSTKRGGTNIVATYKTTTAKYKNVTAKKGVKYFYKVRAYKTVNGKKVFGPWSYVKAFKR